MLKNILNINHLKIGIVIIFSALLHYILLHTIFFLIDDQKISYKLGSSDFISEIRLSFETQKNKPQNQKQQNLTKKIASPIISENGLKTLTNKPEVAVNKEIPTLNDTDFFGIKPTPHYPKRSLLLNQEGLVTLKALVNTNGKVLKVIVISSSGFPLLDKSAKLAISNWKFYDVKQKSASSTIWVKIPVEFIISPSIT